jgi:hypothetical protein
MALRKMVMVVLFVVVLVIGRIGVTLSTVTSSVHMVVGRVRMGVMSASVPLERRFVENLCVPLLAPVGLWLMKEVARFANVFLKTPLPSVQMLCALCTALMVSSKIQMVVSCVSVLRLSMNVDHLAVLCTVPLAMRKMKMAATLVIAWILSARLATCIASTGTTKMPTVVIFANVANQKFKSVLHSNAWCTVSLVT